MADTKHQQGPAAFVVIGGPDGVGKTTVAHALLDEAGGERGYFHFRPPLRGGLDTEPSQNPPRPKRATGGSMVAGWVRLLRSSALCWVGYLRSIRPVVRRGGLVVGDRWIYGYLAQPASLRFSGPEWLARIGVRLAPRPDLLVNLTAPATVIRDRKGELTVAQIERELDLWRSIDGPMTMTVDARESPEKIAALIVDRLHG